MKVKAVGRLIDTSADTVRRWCGDYAAFLSPGANPPAGVERKLNTHDVKVLNYVAIARTAGDGHQAITEALARMQAGGYADLPEVPPDWIKQADGRISVTEASENTQQMIDLTALQVINQTLRERLEDAESRAETLQRELDHLRATQSATESQLHGVELELERARGEVSALKSQVDSFTLAYGMGRDKPLPIAAIIVAALLIGALLVIVSMVIARVIL